MNQKYWWSLGLLAFALALLLFGIIRAIDPASGEPTACIQRDDRDRINVLTREAIDQAFRDQVAHLFTVWLKDPAPEPKRAMAGMANSISAYQRARANAEAWRPAECK